MKSENAEDTQRPNVLKWIRNPDVADFWGKHRGTVVYPAWVNMFLLHRYSLWIMGSFRGLYGNGFRGHWICANLICRLDEYDIGTVNVAILDEFAGPKILEIKNAEYMFKGRTTSSSAISRNTEETPSSTSTVSISTPPPQTPLLVWVDDNPSNNVSWSPTHATS